MHSCVVYFLAKIVRRPFPQTRQRRLRKTPWIRDLVAESSISPSDFIYPLFVHDRADSEPIVSMPGVSRLSIDETVCKAEQAAKLGIPAIMLFPVIDEDKKNALGSNGYQTGNLICRTLVALKQAQLPIGLITDIALDPFTSHSHDGVLDDNGDVDNDKTVELLVQQALLYAEHGADILAPSDMQDGRIGAIREALEQHHHPHVGIMSYTAKYSSKFYGPFRDAIDAKGLSTASIPGMRTDKHTYQMSPANASEAIVAAQNQLSEGADTLIVKPCMAYLDIVAKLKETTSAPIFAYQVSGEYSMLCALARTMHADPAAYWLETCLCAKRAGASAIITYAALSLAQTLRSGR